MTVTVVDYGMGNVGSIVNMLRRLGHAAIVTSDAETILKAEKLILPGVGAFNLGMKRLHEMGLVEALNQKVLVERTPVLGICLGLQLMAKGSTEGEAEGLGWVDANVVRFDAAKAVTPIRIPHMGWNIAKPIAGNGLIDAAGPQRFYFVHGYHLSGLAPEQTLCTTDYGYEFASGIASGNIFAVQFHPEKSHQFGMRLIKNFIEGI